MKHTITIRFVPTNILSHPRPGTSLLLAAQQAGLPLGSSCDGEAVCGYCRVQILEGHENLPPPGVEEIQLLRRVNARPDERIACLTYPRGPIVVTTSYW